MTRNPREPKAVRALIAKHTKATPQKPPVNAVHFTVASLWAKIRLRRPDRQ